jgi:hypothetical protein
MKAFLQNFFSHGGFHPVLLCYLALPSMDPPQFLFYDSRLAIFVFHIGVGWQHPFLGTLLAVETMCLGLSWWFSLCPVVLLGPSLHGPTSISLTIIDRLYLCSTLVLGGSTHHLELYYPWKPCVWAGHGGFHPVTSCSSALGHGSMDTPQFLCYDCR